ncbi:MAG: SEC-C domain-containing protein, partial [Candidatus Aureabacteria bacterium]|nr:SEC-C domain-containing protein [Candidatus Auribacterota bacterium]
PLIGLHVIGSERHESRRIDLQLRGRSGRQGDPGSSRFFISLEDDLMRLFGSDRIVGLMEKLGLEEGQEIQHPFLNKAIQNAQKKVEERNFAIRKQTLEFDDVMNKQREIIYEIRNEALQSDNLKELVLAKINEYVSDSLESIYAQADAESSPESIKIWFESRFPLALRLEDIQKQSSRESVEEFLMTILRNMYAIKEKFESPEKMREMERFITLTTIDRLWNEQLYNMDDLRSSIGLRSYGQRDPLVEYKAEGFYMFKNMISSLNEEIASGIFRITSLHSDSELVFDTSSQQNIHHDFSALQDEPAHAPVAAAANRGTPIKKDIRIGRNDPCPCGSGKKYKKCCGK